MAGGKATVENIELRYRAHKAYEAQVFFSGDVAREFHVGCGRCRRYGRDRLAPRAAAPTATWKTAVNRARFPTAPTALIRLF